METLRRRMRALIEAMFATGPRPLLRLRDEWKVTHLIIDRRHFDSQPPSYFKPFDGWIGEAIRQGHARGFEIPRQWAKAAIFSREHIVIIDLDKLVTRPSTSRVVVPRRAL